jgi:GTP cyclohydrolase II
MRNGFGYLGSHLLGDKDDIGVERGLAEFRAGRPIVISADHDTILALPIDGASDERFAAFRALCGPAAPRLAVTARRARALGIDVSEPVTLTLAPSDTARSAYALASDVEPRRIPAASAANAAASAAIDLAKLAERLPALVVSPITPAARDFDPPLITVSAGAVAHFQQEVVRSLSIAGDARVPLEAGLAARFVVFRNAIGGGSVAIIVGAPDMSRPVPVRMHSACLTGDVFGSRRCDCGDQLRLALKRVQAAGGGIILYLDQEGRGLGLVNKMRAYSLQDGGLDTVDANTTLGFDDDERDYAIAGRMLEMLGCTRVLLLTNNPAKLNALTDAGIEICGRMSLKTPINADNRRYMTAKARRAGHLLDGFLTEADGAEKHPEHGLAPPA